MRTMMTLVAALAVGSWGLVGCEEFDQPPTDPPQQQPGEPADEPGQPGANDPLGTPAEEAETNDDFGQTPGTFNNLESEGDTDDGELAPPPAPQE